jgi:hypothetical protein
MNFATRLLHCRIFESVSRVRKRSTTIVCARHAIAVLQAIHVSENAQQQASAQCTRLQYRKRFACPKTVNNKRLRDARDCIRNFVDSKKMRAYISGASGEARNVGVSRSSDPQRERRGFISVRSATDADARPGEHRALPVRHRGNGKCGNRG